MVSAALLGFIAILVEMVGMRCTTCLAGEPQQKDKVALGGGVIFLISGPSRFDFRHMKVVFGALRSKFPLSGVQCVGGTSPDTPWMLPVSH